MGRSRMEKMFALNHVGQGRVSIHRPDARSAKHQARVPVTWRHAPATHGATIKSLPQEHSYVTPLIGLMWLEASHLGQLAQARRPLKAGQKLTSGRCNPL